MNDDFTERLGHGRRLHETAPEVNRAFSAVAFWVPLVLGRCPRLTINTAPLALRQIPETFLKE
jgi:hypothetical protein